MENVGGFGNGFHRIVGKDDFDPSAPPPFKIAEI